MAVKIELASDEVILLQKDGIKHGGVMASYSGELILTSQNLIFIKKGLFGGMKNMLKTPLKEIKMY